ncbi:hypothetical protein EYF80_010494 [Liparis tanakae]|uniref:Uncharacterized protein n=1 Tax=Liparis tanakae TaxID=230148 RepID=A0A4Z2IMK8_9TELE|nr:hypothetical protein EYF80_010494 [Liparis tanakae]
MAADLPENFANQGAHSQGQSAALCFRSLSLSAEPSLQIRVYDILYFTVGLTAESPVVRIVFPLAPLEVLKGVTLLIS